MDTEIQELIAKGLGIEKLREHQVNALKHVVILKDDVLVVLSTGSGKSVCFQALTVANELINPESQKNCVLLISPLKFLMKQQEKKLHQLHLSATCLSSKPKHEDIVNGKFRFIIGSPEDFLQDMGMQVVLQHEEFRKSLLCIVFDEVHTAISWGLSKDGKKAFRSYFSKVGDLRAFFPGVPLMGLTATASKANQMKIQQLLCMRNPFVISKTPDRPNISMTIAKASPGLDCLEWLVDMLDNEGDKCGKILVYCRTFSDCKDVYRYFHEYFGGNTDDLAKREFDMVHSRTPEVVKVHVQEAIQNMHSALRILIATKIIGMGLDMWVDLIVHFGLPSTVEDYLQQIGRCGRQGQQSHAIMFYNSKQFRNVDPEMLRIVKSEGCIRENILKGFDRADNQDGERLVRHLCCSTCKKECACGKCQESQNPYEQYCSKSKDAVDDQSDIQRDITEEQKAILKVDLFELKERLDHEVYMSDQPLYGKPDILHGLDVATIKCILAKADRIFSVDDIITKCSLEKYKTACVVVEVFSSIFHDVDDDVEIGEDLGLCS